MTEEITVEDCVESMKEAEKQLGHSPTVNDYKELDIRPTPTTIQRKVGWNECKKILGLTTFQSVGSEGFEFCCYLCDSIFRSTSDQDFIRCKGCDSSVSRVRSKIHHMKQNDKMCGLSEGPVVDQSQVPSNPYGFVHRINPPSVLTPTGKGETVYYLYGDDREAMRLFIDCHEEMLAEVMQDNRSNSLQSQWDEDMWYLFLEEWYLQGYDEK